MIHATGKVRSAAWSTPARGSQTFSIASAIRRIRRIRRLGPIASLIKPVNPWTLALVCNIGRHFQVPNLTQKLTPGPLQTQTPCAASTRYYPQKRQKMPDSTRKTNSKTRTNPEKSGQIRVNPAKSGQKMKIHKMPGFGDCDQ